MLFRYAQDVYVAIAYPTAATISGVNIIPTFEDTPANLTLKGFTPSTPTPFLDVLLSVLTPGVTISSTGHSFAVIKLTAAYMQANAAQGVSIFELTATGFAGQKSQVIWADEWENLCYQAALIPAQPATLAAQTTAQSSLSAIAAKTANLPANTATILGTPVSSLAADLAAAAAKLGTPAAGTLAADLAASKVQTDKIVSGGATAAGVTSAVSGVAGQVTALQGSIGSTGGTSVKGLIGIPASGNLADDLGDVAATGTVIKNRIGTPAVSVAADLSATKGAADAAAGAAAAASAAVTAQGDTLAAIADNAELAAGAAVNPIDFNAGSGVETIRKANGDVLKQVRLTDGAGNPVGDPRQSKGRDWNIP